MFRITETSGCEHIPIVATNSSLESLSPDSDLDGILDSRDNCPPFPNPPQNDSNDDGIGDACDGNISGKQGGPLKNDAIDFNADDVIDSKDTCPYSASTNETNVDVDIHHIANICYPYGIGVPIAGNTNSTINATALQFMKHILNQK